MEIASIINYLSGFAVLATVYAVLALGLNVHWGATGLLNLGIAGFFALGAYTSALLTTAPPDPGKQECQEKQSDVGSQGHEVAMRDVGESHYAVDQGKPHRRQS